MEVLYQLSAKEWLNYKPEDAFYMKRPRVINFLQWDGEKFVYPANMKYLTKPKESDYPLNLNKNRDLHVFWNSCAAHPLKFIEEHFMHSNFAFDDPDVIEKIKICTSRGLLVNIMKTATSGYLKHFIFYATKYDGIIYLTKQYIENRLFKDGDKYHYKLQQYCFADKPNGQPDVESGVDENKDVVAIYQTELKNFYICYYSEICGAEEEEPIEDMTDFDDINNRKFVATRVVPEISNWQKNYRVINWWLQAYMTNVTAIYLGFKDQNALIKTPIKQVAVRDLPKMKNFEPHVCTQFLHKFLTMVDEKMSGINCPETVCQFEFDLEQRCFLYKMHKGKTEFSFLTDKFVKYLQSRA